MTFAHGPTSQAWGGAWTITRAANTSTTASQVLAAVAATPAAAVLISGTLASGNNGTGAVTAMSQIHFALAKETYTPPMSFINTSINDAGNTLT